MNIQKQRKDNNLTQKELAEAVNSAYGTSYTSKMISRVENGHAVLDGMVNSDLEKFFKSRNEQNASNGDGEVQNVVEEVVETIPEVQPEPTPEPVVEEEPTEEVEAAPEVPEEPTTEEKVQEEEPSQEVEVAPEEEPEPVEEATPTTEEEPSVEEETMEEVQEEEPKAPEKVEIIRLKPDEIKEIRKDLGLSQEKMAMALGMKRSSAAAICDWEKGRITIPLHHQASLEEWRNQGGIEETPEGVEVVQ